MTRTIRIAHRADAHVGAAHMGRLLEDGRHTALEGQRAVMLAFIAQAKERDVEIIVNGGDETHTPRPSPDAWHILGQYHAAREFAKIREFAIEGNHTLRGGETVTSVAPFLAKHLAIAQRPRLDVIQFQDLDRELQVAYFPWMPLARIRALDEDVTSTLQHAAVDIVRGLASQLDPKIPSVLICHATIAGAETSTGFSMGYIADELGWKIPIEELVPFTYVAAGHIHRPQKVAANAAYAGSMYPVDFAEGHEHGWWHVELDADRPRILRHEFVLLPTPDVTDLMIEAPALVDELVEFPVSAGELIRVRVTGDPVSIRHASPAAIAAELYAKGAGLVQVELEVERATIESPEDWTKPLGPADALEFVTARREDLNEELRLRILGHGFTLATSKDREVRGAGAGGLRLRRIEACNVMRLGAAAVDLDGEGVVSVTGPVGAGKTALFCDVPRLVLTGASRVGARPSVGLIRDGAEEASAAIELEAADGRRLRIVRRYRRLGTDRGIGGTLDVLERRGERWEPLSQGKRVEGQRVIDELIGGLSDRTLTAATFVVQRAADSFTSAPPEERSRILAEAADVAVYDELAEASRAQLRDAERALDIARGKAEPLRPRALAVSGIALEATAAATERTKADEEVRLLQRDLTTATELHEKVRERVAERDRVQTEAEAVQTEIERLEAELAKWARLSAAANEIIGHRLELEDARRRLDGARSEIGRLEGELDKARIDSRRRADGQMEVMRLERERATEKSQRETKLADARAALRTERRQRDELVASGCLANCTHLEGCTTATSARMNAVRITVLERDEKTYADVGRVEIDLERRIIQVRSSLTPEPDTNGITAQLVIERSRVQDLERASAVAEKIGAAEQVLRDAEAAGPTLEQQREEKRTKRGDLNRRLLAFAGVGAELEKRRSEQDRITRELDERQREAQRAGERVALLEGRLVELRAAAADLKELEVIIEEQALEAAAWQELVGLWKAARLLVLSESVVPAVERTANEILALSTTGLQLQLERDAAKDTIELRLLGGLAPSYELASGGQRTWIDVATHVAIALVIAQRSRTPLGFMFIDEPEGLDAPNRAAFGRVLRWIHDSYGIVVLAASHHEDLVELLAERTFVLEAGPDGSTVRAA